MKCPFCSNELRQVKSKTAIVDICPNCRGLWFDSGELSVFAQELARGEKVAPQKTKLFHRRDVQPLHKLKETKRLCPKCNKPMRKFNYAGDSNVFLDKCQDCNGIWADRGEVEKIAAFIKEDPAAAAVGRVIVDSFMDPSQECSEDIGRWWAVCLLYIPRLIVPLADDTPRKRFPIVTILLIVSSVLLYIGHLVVNPDYLAELFDFIPKDLLNIDLFASMFSQGGPLQLIWNVLFLWLFGDNVEDRFSRFGYLLFFLACGLFTSIFYLISQSDIPVSAVGITGAVSGIMGAYFIFYPVAKIKIFVIYSVMEVPAAVCLGLWVFFQLLYPFLFKLAGRSAGFCFAAVGGFIFGALVACIKKTMITTRD